MAKWGDDVNWMLRKKPPLVRRLDTASDVISPPMQHLTSAAPAHQHGEQATTMSHPDRDI